MEIDISDQESLEDLLRKAISAISSLWRVVIVAIICTALAFVLLGVGLYVIWDDNEDDNVKNCRAGNDRAKDLVILVEKVQDIVGGPGESSSVDELVEFAHASFVQADCDGDGTITDNDLP